MKRAAVLDAAGRRVRRERARLLARAALALVPSVLVLACEGPEPQCDDFDPFAPLLLQKDRENCPAWVPATDTLGECTTADGKPCTSSTSICDSMSVDDCTACAKSACCAEGEACFSDGACTCSVQHATGQVASACGAPDAKYHALAMCLAASCPACPRLP